jgi:hypothetical protein
MRADLAAALALLETKIHAVAAETESQVRSDCGSHCSLNKRGRPRRTTIPPWITAGMSRATWYRHRKNEEAECAR